MGVTDEHWCTLCRKKLDKARDKYIDFELIHQAAKPIKKHWQRPKGLICMDCIEKDEKLKQVLDAILKAGNPNFAIDIRCYSSSICPSYQPTGKPAVNCRHIAVIGDTVYCKRGHPGSVKLMVERAEKQRRERQLLIKLIKRVMKDLPEPMRLAAETMFSQGLAGSWQPPTAVIANDRLEGEHEQPIVRNDSKSQNS